MKEIIKEGCKAWQLDITDAALDRLEAFSRELIEKNRVMNLTAITDARDIARRHFLDCIFIMTLHELRNKKIIDVGCGAGFPCMPLLCCEPELDITALDSTGKRISFISDCANKMRLNINPVIGRAEEYAKLRFQAYDVVLSRAVAPLNILSELCLPFLRIGGVFLAQKTANAQEREEAKNAITTLGCEIANIYPYNIPGVEGDYTVIEIKKVKDTPEKYPRRYAKISSAPL